MRTLAVIPSRFEFERLRAMALPLLDEVDVLVLDNGHEPQLVSIVDPRLRVIDARGMGIYAMWNLGWRVARDEGYGAVALLNDDVRILPGTVTLMGEALDRKPNVGVVYPDWPLPLTAGMPRRLKLQRTAGTVTQGGMTGFCFAFRTDLPVPPFDESFGWWYGDDSFERSVRKARYGVARIVGLPCEHESDSEANDWARRPELRAIAEADRRRWISA